MADMWMVTGYHSDQSLLPVEFEATGKALELAKMLVGDEMNIPFRRIPITQAQAEQLAATTAWLPTWGVRPTVPVGLDWNIVIQKLVVLRQRKPAS